MQYGDRAPCARPRPGTRDRARHDLGPRPDLDETEMLAAARRRRRVVSLPFLSVAEARERLKSMPLIKSASVRKLYPNALDDRARPSASLRALAARRRVCSSSRRRNRDRPDAVTTVSRPAARRRRPARAHQGRAFAAARRGGSAEVADQRAGTLVAERRWTLQDARTASTSACRNWARPKPWRASSSSIASKSSSTRTCSPSTCACATASSSG